MTTPSSDEKLRDLERKSRQTGSPDDEAAWLLERVRVGDLTQERLELAAYCGHEGARRARLAKSSKAPGSLRRVIEEMAEGIEPMGAVAALFIALEPIGRFSKETLVTDAIDRIRQALACPCTKHAMASRAASDVIDLEFLDRVTAPQDWPNAMNNPRYHANAVIAYSLGRLAKAVHDAISRDSLGVRHVASDLLSLLPRIGLPLDNLRQVVLSGVGAWCLGERIEATCARLGPCVHSHIDPDVMSAVSS